MTIGQHVWLVVSVIVLADLSRAFVWIIQSRVDAFSEEVCLKGACVETGDENSESNVLN